MCYELGITRVHFEGDAKGVVDVVNSGDMEISWMGHVIADIKMEIQEFEGWEITFVKREGNQVPHLLAKPTVQHVHNTTWREAPLDCICETLLLEKFALVS